MNAGTTALLATPGSGAPRAWPLGMSQSWTAPVSLPVASVRLSRVIAALTIPPASPASARVTGLNVAVA